MPLVSVLLLPYEGYKPRGTGRKHRMGACMWSIFLVMMRNRTCMTNPNPLLWFPSAADSFPTEYAATFYSVSGLWAYTVPGDWSWQFNSFCTENCEFCYWDHIWCLDIQTLASDLESHGRAWITVLGCAAGTRVGGSAVRKPLRLEPYHRPRPALWFDWLSQQWYGTRGAILRPVGSLTVSSSEFQSWSNEVDG